MKKVLVLGARGAMGVHLVPELIKDGWRVDAVDRETGEALENVNYTVANALDDDWLFDFLEGSHYDAIIDFMLYFGKDSFEKRYKKLLDSTDHYIFLSSYRIYADREHPVKETSPRLLEAVSDPEFLADCDKEYGLYKAQEENILNSSGYKNYTILRPTMVYSTRRYQLVGLEACTFLRRVVQGKKVVLPEKARKLHAALIWSGDVAKMITALLNNEKAMGETFTICNGEENSWEEVAELYKTLVGLDYEFIDTDEYLTIFKDNITEYRKHIYDRFYDRNMDPTKILTVTGIKKEDLTPLRVGLKKEISSLPKNYLWWENDIEKAMDKLVKEKYDI